MTRTPLRACALLVGSLAACGPAGREPARTSAAPEPSGAGINTGDPLPASAPPSLECADRGAARWLASSPHTPFAITRRSVVADASACCAAWAVKGSHWQTVDAWGQVAGDAVVTGGAGYDVTQCYELELAITSGGPGAGLFVAEGGGWVAPRSAQWEPTEAEQRGLVELAAAADRLFRPAPDLAADPLGEVLARSLFFKVPPSVTSEGQSRRFAVVGGRALLVASLEADGAWILRHMEPAKTSDAVGTFARYTPLAAFDMNRDGVPELIFHENFGESWSDVVLELVNDEAGRRFVRTVESVPGSTA